MISASSLVIGSLQIQDTYSHNETEGMARKPVRSVNASNQLTEAGKIGTQRKDVDLNIRNSLIKRTPY